MIFRKVTFWFTAFAVAISLFHHYGYDHDNVAFLMASPPSWVIPLFTNLMMVNRYFLYGLTVAFWFGFGLYIDYLIARAARKRRTAR